MGSAAKIAMGFRTLFNLPESMTLIRRLRGRRAPRYWNSVLEYCAEGNLQSVMDEYIHVLFESMGLSGKTTDKAIPEIATEVSSAVSIRTVNLDFDEIIPDSVSGALKLDRRSLRCRFALRFGDGRSEEEQTEIRKDQVRSAFNSPFRPFVLATTSIGQEGLDFHQYCHEVYHWNLPSNPVDLEQREGRVHRYKGHAIRRNISQRFPLCRLVGKMFLSKDPWKVLFEFAREEAMNKGHEDELVPYWLYPYGSHKIIRYVPIYPFSRDEERLEALKRSLVTYRMGLGQPRQEDLISFLQQRFKDGIDQSDFSKYQIDLTPR